MSLDITSINSQDNINSSKANGGNVYEFEGFRLDAAHRMLYRSGEPLILAPKVVETLIVLIEKRGEVVSKDELMTRLWADAFVEESNLTQNIYLLRKTLGKKADGTPLIETFRRRGYRFNCSLKTLYSDRDGDDRIVASKTEEFSAFEQKINDFPIKTSKARINSKGLLFILAAAAVLLVFGTAGLLKIFTVKELSKEITLKRLTPDIYAYNPALSPDGRYLAYAEIRDGKTSVWLKDIGSGSVTQLLPVSDRGYKGLQFSYDGESIYYLTARENLPNHIAARVSLADRSIIEIAGNVISPVAVSADNSRLAFIDGFGDLVLINSDGSGKRTLKKRDDRRWFNGWDAEMSFSPDGEKIVVCGGFIENGKISPVLLEVSVLDGTERQLAVPENWRAIGGVLWLRDGTGLIVTAREALGQPSQVWRVSYKDGTAERLTNDLNDYEYVTASADGKAIVAERQIGNLNVWEAQTTDFQNLKQITWGKAAKDGFSGLAALVDGKVVYTSIRSGSVDLWLTGTDGGNHRQLTGGQGAWNSRPQASPDGRYIVFASSRAGGSDIWRMDVDGGNQIRLTTGEAMKTRPAISPDSSWVYYTSGEGSDKSSIWKIPITGGEPIRVSEHSFAWGAYPSPDGKLIAYNHNEAGSPKPWKVGLMKAAGGAAIKLFDLKVYGGILGWTADSKNILYINGESPSIWKQPIDGSKPRPLTDFGDDRITYFSFSPDYKRMVFSRGNLTTEAVLISIHP